MVHKPDIPSLAFTRAKCVACGGWIPGGSKCLRAFAPKAGLKHAGCPQVSLPGVNTDPGPKVYMGPLVIASGLRMYPYQEEGLRGLLWRADAEQSTLLADEMGLGKTAQALALLHMREEWKKVLVVCPAALRYNWRQEAARWAPRRVVQLWPEERLSEPDATLTVVAYSQLAKIPAAAQWDLTVCDEAHYLKSPEALRTQLAKALAARSARLILLTGSPLENRHKELWTLLQLIDPQTWDPPGLAKGRPVGAGQGAGERAFLTRYCGLRKARRRVRNREGGFSYQAYEDDRGSTHGAELFGKIAASGAMIRRRKADVLPQLPPKVRELIRLPPPADPRVLEAEHQAFVATGLDYAASLEHLTKARLMFEDWAAARVAVAEAKIPHVLDHVKCLLESEAKVLVFGHHRVLLDALAEAFSLEECVTYTGGTPEKARADAVRRFQEDPACRVFLGSLGAAGVGLTLTAARVVVFAEIDGKDPRQAEDRVHRIGQEADSVLIQTLVFDGSVDANLARLMKAKVEIAEMALDGRRATL